MFIKHRLEETHLKKSEEILLETRRCEIFVMSWHKY